MKNGLHHMSINHLRDYNFGQQKKIDDTKLLNSIQSEHIESTQTSDQIFILTEAHQGIPIFEWILHNAGKNQVTENKAALIMREIFLALGAA